MVKRGMPERAIASLRRLRPNDTEEQILVRLASVQLAVATSIEDAKSQSDSYLECFKGTDLKRTLTVITVSYMQSTASTAADNLALVRCAILRRVPSLKRSLLPVSWLLAYLRSDPLTSSSQTGLEFSVVSQVSLAFLGLGVIFCLFASFFLEKLGRRNTLIWGSLGHASLLILIGCLHYAQSRPGKLATAILFNFAVSTAQFSTTAPTFAMSIEISSVRLRSKTQSLGFGVYYIIGWIFLFTVPYMFQPAPAGAGWGTRSCWLFAGLTICFAIFGYFFAGETKGRSYADVDLLYQKGIPPRRFHRTEVAAEREATA